MFGAQSDSNDVANLERQHDAKFEKDYDGNTGTMMVEDQVRDRILS